MCLLRRCEQDSRVLGLKDMCREGRTVKDILLSKHASKIPADHC